MTHPDIRCMEDFGLTPEQLQHANDPKPTVECDFCGESTSKESAHTCERCGRTFCKDCGRYHEHWDVTICSSCKDDIRCVELEMPDRFELSHKTYSRTGVRREEGYTIIEYACEGGVLPPIEYRIDVHAWVAQGEREREERNREYWKSRKANGLT